MYVLGSGSEEVLGTADDDDDDDDADADADADEVVLNEGLAPAAWTTDAKLMTKLD